MKYIEMKAGDLRVVTMPSHEGDRGGVYTFVVTGLAMDEYTQWSVVGARKSELVKTMPDKIGCDSCVIHINDNEYTSEARVVNVSVIGTDLVTKEQVETKAILTLSIIPATAKEDFSILEIEGPHEVILKEDGSLTPNEITVTARLNQTIEAGIVNVYSGYVTLDIQGDYIASHVFAVEPKVGTRELVSPNMYATIFERIEKNMGDREYLEGSYTVEVFKEEGAGEEKVTYYHSIGDKFIIRKEHG